MRESLNYIRLINSFWAANLEYNFTGNEAKLYFFLLHVSNSLGWKNPFKHSLRQIQAGTMISLNSIKAAQQRLMEAGLIDIKLGKSGNRFDIANKTEYTIISVSNFDTATDTPTDTATDTATDTPTDTINKLKKNKQPKGEKSKNFLPPSLDELKTYFAQKVAEKRIQLNPTVEAEKFEAFYSSKNWFVGKNKMVSWQKAVSGWILKATPQNTPQINSQTPTKLKAI